MSPFGGYLVLLIFVLSLIMQVLGRRYGGYSPVVLEKRITDLENKLKKLENR
jgi:hypothetical protein